MLSPGDTLIAMTDQAVLVDKLQSSVAFNGSATVQRCLECTPPKAAIVGPQVGFGDWS